MDQKSAKKINILTNLLMTGEELNHLTFAEAKIYFSGEFK